LASFDSIETMRRKDIVMLRLDRAKIQVVQACLDQIGEKQMWEQRKLPGVRFFVVEHQVNDFPQVRVSLFIILLQSLFQLPEGD
jgi:hypothetical protein